MIELAAEAVQRVDISPSSEPHSTFILLHRSYIPSLTFLSHLIDPGAVNTNWILQQDSHITKGLQTG